MNALLPRRVVTVIAIALLLVTSAHAADAPAKPAVKSQLPNETPYQQALRKYLGTLAEKDFDPGVPDAIKTPTVADPQDRYRLWLLTLDFPRVGVIMHGARNAPGVNLPNNNFLLANIEDAQRGVIQPAVWPETIVWLANWKYEGNPFFGSRAVKLRAFVAATVDMLMMDDQQEHSTAPLYRRSDWFGPHLLMYGYVLAGAGDAVAPEGRAAYEACLRNMMKRVSAWGPRGDENYLDTITVLGMRVAADALKDPESAKLSEAYARKFFSDPWCYNPAGYFPEQGCYDAGFNGLSLFYMTWLALQAPDWKFVQDGVRNAWRLRGDMLLPEPDGTFTGLSHTNARTGSDASEDQWPWRFKPVAASYLFDEALSQARFPTDEQLAAAPEAVRTALAPQVANYPESNQYMQRSTSNPWQWKLYPNAFDFPMVNYGHVYYPNGFYAKRAALEKAGSPLLKVPFARSESFIRAYEKSFLVAKRPAFGAIVHTGPVSEFKGEGHVEFTGPYGLSGGSLSAFWTPATGSVILGRRSGMQFPNNKNPNFDMPENWRTWPVHAVTGVTGAGKLFTSARIQNPDATYDTSAEKAVVNVKGVVPPGVIGNEKNLEGKLDFARTFTVDDKGVSIETTIAGDGKDTIAELYEVIPVYHRNAYSQPNGTPTTIEFESGGKWSPATEQFADNVTAVRLTRFTGAVDVRFDKPRRVKLSPADWTDTFMTRASCRNVLIDLLESGDKPAAVKDAKKVSYRIAPVK